MKFLRTRRALTTTAVIGALALAGAACEASVEGDGEELEGDVNLEEEGGEEGDE